MAHLMSGDTQAGVAQFRELARDEFAAIPRDMFWFTAIALLGETCALIGDVEQAPVLYRLLAPHSERLVQVSQAANLGSTHRFLALLSAAQGQFEGAEHHFEAGLERNAACGLRPVVALMRREFAEMLIARGDPVRARDLLRQTLKEAEQGGMSQLISRVRMRLDELEASRLTSPWCTTRPPTTVSQTGMSGRSSAGASTGSTASPVRSARIPTWMRPETPVLAGGERGRERVAGERLVRRQRLLGPYRQLLRGRRQPP